MKELFYNGEIFKELETSDEADNWAKCYFNDVIEATINSETYMSLMYYTGSMARKWNAILRSIDVGFDSVDFDKEYGKHFAPDGDQLRRTKETYNFIISQSIPENIVVYRYMDFSVLERYFNQCENIEGELYIDKGFMSTTLVASLLEEFSQKHQCNCLLKIYVPSGTVGAYVSPHNNFSRLNEQEVLFPPNTKVKILKITKPFLWRLLKKQVYIECVIT